MKPIIILSWLLMQSISAKCQTTLNTTSVEGIWQAIALDIPTLFSFNKETNAFQTFSSIEYALKNDPNGEMKKVVAEIKKAMPVEIGKVYLEIKPGNNFYLNIGEKPVKGSYTFFSKPSSPSPESDEEVFLQYVSNYGYDGGLQLKPEYFMSTTMYANTAAGNNGINLILNNQTIFLSGIPYPCIYTLKKITYEEAIALKNKEKKMEADFLKAKQQKEAEKEKADEEKSGKLYTTADKPPYFSNEKQTILKISESLLEAAMNNGLTVGNYEITAEYTVNKDATITDIKVLGTESESLKNEVIKQIKRLPAHSPAEVNGQKVRFRMKQVFRFIVPND